MHEYHDGQRRWRIDPECRQYQDADGSWVTVSNCDHKCYLAGLGDVQHPHKPQRAYKNPLTGLLKMWFWYMHENPWWGFSSLVIGLAVSKHLFPWISQ